MAPQPVVTGLSPKEGPPGTRVTIRGEFLGSRAADLVGLTICGSDCLLSAEWKSSNKIVARTGAAKGKGDIIVTTLSGGIGTSTIQFRAYHETIGPMKESAVWIEESPMQSLAWGRRSLAPSSYTQEDPLGLSIEGNDNKKFPEDLRDLFPEKSGDLSQENFSPGWFLLEYHHATSFDDLKAGLSFLRRKVESQKEGQLSFLKSNAGSVIDQLDTLMNLRDKFQLDVKDFGKAPVAKLESSIHKSIEESHNLFKDVLNRRETADATRIALQALVRHKFLFALPNTVRHHANKEEYDIIINDYARAKKLFGKSEISIFKKVLLEVDDRILEIRKELHEKILKMPQSVEQQKKFIKALVNLQQLGSPTADDHAAEDPGWQAIEARAAYLEDTFQTTFEAHKTMAKPTRVGFFEEITEITASQLPDLWRLGQCYFAGELRGICEPKPGNFKNIILSAIEKMAFYLRAAILPSGKSVMPWPSSSGQTSQLVVFLPQCLRFIRITYATLIRLDLPNEVLDIVQRLIDELRIYCMSAIMRRAADKVKNLEEKEDFRMGVAEFPGATTLPSTFYALLKDTVDECQVTCLLPEIRENGLLEPQSEGAHELSQRLQDILDKFATVIQSIAFNEDTSRAPSTISQLIGFPTHVSEDKFSAMTWEQKLLCCMANCVYCHKIFYDSLGRIFSENQYAVPALAIETGKANINALFQSLLENYVEMKSDPLVGTIEPSMYIGLFQWTNVHTVDRIRPYASECCDNLIGVYSEIFTISPPLLRLILEPIIQTVAEELARLMSCVQQFSNKGAMQARLDILVVRDVLKLYSNSAARAFFDEALDVLPKSTKEDMDRVEQLLTTVKRDMRLHAMCFTVANP